MSGYRGQGPTGEEEYRAPRQPVGAGPARDFARRARSYMGMARVGRRSGFCPRSAPGRPAIADKVRSYGGGIPCFPTTCRSGPCPRFARRARSYRGMAQVGRRRSGSHPRIAPVCPAIADKVRSYDRASREPLALYPPGAWNCRSGPCPRFARRARSYRGMAWVGLRRSGSHPRIVPVCPAIADKVRSYDRAPREPLALCAPRRGRQGRLVGWVERSDTHRRPTHAIPRAQRKTPRHKAWG